MNTPKLRSIELEVQVPTSPSEAWKAWTTSEGIGSFLCPDNRIEARPGGAFELYFMDDAPKGTQGSEDCVFLALEEPSFLSFTWNAPPTLPHARAQRTVVILRFSSNENGTLATLSHLGWPDGGEWDQAFEYFSRVWPRVLAQLNQRFETGPIDWTQF